MILDYIFDVGYRDVEFVVRERVAVYQAEVKDAQTLGFALQQARLVRGLSQRELADELGVSQRYVWELESGKDSLAVTRLLRALRLTGARLLIEVPEDEAERRG